MEATITLTIDVPESDNETEQAALESLQFSCTDAARSNGITVIRNAAEWKH